MPVHLGLLERIDIAASALECRKKCPFSLKQINKQTNKKPWASLRALDAAPTPPTLNENACLPTQFYTTELS